MNQSLEVINRTLHMKSPFFINATVDDLLEAADNGQFPCGASWNGNVTGAPKVMVPSSWFESKS